MAGSRFSITVSGVVTSGTVAEALTANKAALEAAGYTIELPTGKTMEEAVQAGLKIKRSDGAAFEITTKSQNINLSASDPIGGAGTATATVGKTVSSAGGTYGDNTRLFTDLSGSGASFTLNGTTIRVEPWAKNSAEQVEKVKAAINGKTSETGISATVENGVLKLSSTSTKGIQIAGAGDDLLKRLTGLSINSSVSAGPITYGFSDLDISTTTGADDAIGYMDRALQVVNSARAALGAYQNRFESTIANLTTMSENLTASRSRIMDADFAAETAALSRTQILQQAGMAMVAQANQVPQGVLQLLRS